MFGISFSELLIIFLIVLIVFGPDRLPQIARTLGKAVREFNRKSEEIKDELHNVLKDEPTKNEKSSNILLNDSASSDSISSNEVSHE